jgi:hypothetical protein
MRRLTILLSDGGYFTPSSITIASGDTITFSVPANDPYSAGLEIHNFPGGSFTILPGQSHTTPALVINVPDYYATWPASGCQKGTGSVTVQQNTSPPPPATTPPPVITPPPPATHPQNSVKPPDTLKLDTATVNTDKVDLAKPLKVSQSQPLVISGHTIANGTVNLTIHSVTRNEIVRANDSGFWTFTISNLEPGNHTVDATVTDLSTHLTSTSVTLLKFAVTSEGSAGNQTASIDNTTAAAKKSSSGNIIFAATAALLIAVIDGALFWYLEIRKKAERLEVTEAPPPTEVAPTL